MSNNCKQCLVGAVVVFGLALGQLIAGGLTPPVWAGQAEQFTPEFKEVRKSLDVKHTPKIVAPDTVKRGQWFDVTVSIGSGGEHPSLSEHFIRYIALYINTQRSPGLSSPGLFVSLRLPSRLHWMREDHFARWRSRIILRPGKHQKNYRGSLADGVEAGDHFFSMRTVMV